MGPGRRGRRPSAGGSGAFAGRGAAGLDDGGFKAEKGAGSRSKTRAR